MDAAGGRKDMHRTDLNALAVIMRHTAKGNVVTPGLLRKELQLSSPATTALVDRLHHSGHVVRERLGTDRRQVQLQMTPKAYSDGGAMFMPLPPYGQGHGGVQRRGAGHRFALHDRHGGGHRLPPAKESPTPSGQAAT